MSTYRMTIEYDGTRYHGWQVQPDRITVQEMIERALETLCKHPVRVIPAGRTDAGVHALGQVASFRTESALDLGTVVNSLNALTPRDVAILDFAKTPDEFNARKHAMARHYRYVVLNRQSPTGVRRRFCWHVRESLDYEAIRTALRALVGSHDFSSFRASDCSAKDPVCHIKRAELIEAGDGFLHIELSSTHFLKNMVRAIVGTLHEIGRGKIPPEQMATILAAKDRTKAAFTCPPLGLFFVSVDYPAAYRCN
jgi:tRNA pseudouridine38-40 synthase